MAEAHDAVEVERGRSREDVERGLAGMHVRIDPPVGELRQHQPAVRGAGVAADQLRRREPGAVGRQRRRECDVLAADEQVHLSSFLPRAHDRGAYSQSQLRPKSGWFGFFMRNTSQNAANFLPAEWSRIDPGWRS